MITKHADARVLPVLAVVLLSSLLAFGQNSGTKAESQAQNPSAKAGKRQPCWQVAGLSQSAMQQHKELQQSAHSQIEAVCSDSSLTAQQKREKIREIHQQTKQKMDALITPEQQHALKSCREERGEGRHMAGNKPMHRGGRGPCGNMAMGGEEKTPGASPKE
jgi:Spy/CpxP family protein refolding chaperone